VYVPLVLFDNPGAEELNGFRAPGGVVSIVTAAPVLNLYCVARGYEPKVVTGVTEDTEVRLTRYPEITVRIAAALPEGYRLTALVREGTRDRDPRRYRIGEGGGTLRSYFEPMGPESVPVDASGELIARVRKAGPYTLNLSLRKDSGGRSTSLREFEPKSVDITMPAEGLIFDVTIPPEEIARAVEQLRER
jgi:hypothetical protein